MQTKDLGTVLNRELDDKLLVVADVALSRDVIDALFRGIVHASQAVLGLLVGLLIQESVQDGIQGDLILLLHDSASIVQGANQVSRQV